MAGAEALTATGYGLLDPHLGITEADGLGLATTTGTDHELLGTIRSAPGAVAG